MRLFSATLFAMSVIALAGCSSTTSQYYEAVQKAAEANAVASQAKFEALSKIAAAGDGQAASAAVMALALTQTPVIAPQPQQSQALQWASILAAPLSNVGMMWMQTDATKAMAEYNRDVSLARISADTTTQQALYGAFTDQSSLTANVATTGLTAMGNVDYTSFIDGMVSISNTGMNSVVTLEQSDNELVEALVSQYGSTVNTFLENPLVNTTTTTTTTTNSVVTCNVDANGVVVCK